MGVHAADPETEEITYDRPVFDPYASSHHRPPSEDPSVPATAADFLQRITWPMVGMAWVVGVTLVAITLALAGDTRRASSTMTMTLIIGLVLLIIDSRRHRNNHRE